MSSTTAEEALLRAKAIAAKLTGQDVVGSYGDGGVSTSTDTTVAASTTSKRKRWGVAPAIVQEAAAVSPLMAVKKFKAGAPEASSSNKKIWVRTTKERGAAHFKAYFATRLISLQDELNEGKSDDGKVTLELQGRGSSGKPLPGVPVEPLHILITGSDTAIVAAELPVDDVLTQAEQAPVEAVDPEEDTGPEPSLNGDNSMALTTTGNRYTSNSAYRPATVAQLISNNPIHHVGGGDLIEETINVPNGMVGFLIGRGGETITSMQARSGCKVQIQKEQDLVPGQTHRVITLEATSQDSIDQCREMIESMVQDRMRAAGGTFGGGGGGGGGGSSKDAKVQEALSMGHALVELEVPDADVGLIIGKGGMTIKSIQDQTGAQVQIPPRPADDKPEVRTVSITHPTEEGAQLAKRRIEDVLASKPSFSEDRRVQGPQVTVQIMIPDRDVGLCIGRQGCVIKEMQNKTGTRIQIPSQPTPGQSHRVATVIGTQEGCNKVQAFIDRIMAEQSSACVMSNGAPVQQPYYEQQHQAASNPEWQAYYAAQQAVARQQQQQQVPAAAPAPGADAYYEQFFRYAYYYGEPAARQYYGAWSPPEGTPNPYGVNPNGVTAPPVAAPAAAAVAATPAPAPQPPISAQAPRDSGVRKVSNLPAWMTQGK